MPHNIIRKISLAHCKRGPQRCEKCREMSAGAICLLDIDPPNPGKLQRRVIEVRIGGQPAWREYDVVRVFASQQEAASYACTHGIEDVLFDNL